MDEFSVTPQGNASLSTAYKGWLGRPLGEHYAVGAGWRRDFQGGSVLVNPSSSSVTFNLGAGFYRILGISAPTVNDGAAVTSQVVPSHDAIFVQRRPPLN
jgi:hypothetical protein